MLEARSQSMSAMRSRRSQVVAAAGRARLGAVRWVHGRLTQAGVGTCGSVPEREGRGWEHSKVAAGLSNS